MRRLDAQREGTAAWVSELPLAWPGGKGWGQRVATTTSEGRMTGGLRHQVPMCPVLTRMDEKGAGRWTLPRLVRGYEGCEAGWVRTRGTGASVATTRVRGA